MKTELINQYTHTWRVFSRLVETFDPDTWLHTGRGAITPARLSLHILQSARYYMQDPAPVRENEIWGRHLLAATQPFPYRRTELALE